MATLTLRSLCKSFGPIDVIKGIDLDIADRSFVVFVGPSGCGKSTLLRMIAGLEPITGGELRIDGVRVNEVRAAERGLAMVFQSYALYPHMTVRQNMGFALRLARVPRAERDRKVTDAARILQLEPYLDRRPKDLSGGQRQRVAIGRAIVRQPKVFLFDEPLSNLDAALRGQTRVELLRLHEDLKATMIYVTHDQVEAMTMADTIVVLQAGRVEQVGSPLELYHHPRNLFVAGFIGSPRMNLVPATVAAAGEEGVTVALPSGIRFLVPVLPAGVQSGQAVTLGIRPETLRPETGGTLRGEVRLVEHLGGLTLLHVDTEHDGPLTVQTDGDAVVVPHQPIGLAAHAPACHVFDASGQALPSAGPPWAGAVTTVPGGAALRLTGLVKRWPGGAALDGVSLSVAAGSFAVLLGPSGCGKSTCLRIVAGLEAPDVGRVEIDGRDVTALPPSARGIAMVFQSYALFPHLSVAENILFGLRARRVPAPERRRRLDAAATMLGLEPLLGRKPGQLSGGQQQRVALGRAMVAQARVCLMDEPLSNLDAQLRADMRREILDLQRRLGMTMLYVTHDQTEAMAMADQVVLLRRGRVEQDAAPAALYAAPATRFAAGFIGTPPMNLLPAEALGRAPDGAGTVGIRPEALRLAASGLPCTVEHIEYLGADSNVTLRLTGAPLIARVPGRSTLAVGSTAALAFDPADLHFFDADGRRMADTPDLGRSTATHISQGVA